MREETEFSVRALLVTSCDEGLVLTGLASMAYGVYVVLTSAALPPLEAIVLAATAIFIIGFAFGLFSELGERSRDRSDGIVDRERVERTRRRRGERDGADRWQDALT